MTVFIPMQVRDTMRQENNRGSQERSGGIQSPGIPDDENEGGRSAAGRRHGESRSS